VSRHFALADRVREIEDQYLTLLRSRRPHGRSGCRATGRW
jgi:hypothetical protein